MTIHKMDNGWYDRSSEGPCRTHLTKEGWVVFRSTDSDHYAAYPVDKTDNAVKAVKFAHEAAAIEYVERELRRENGEPQVQIQDLKDPQPGPRSNLNTYSKMLSQSRVQEFRDYASNYGEFDMNTPLDTASKDDPLVVFTAERRGALRAYLTVLGIVRTPV
jgi:hypothetical protein